MANNDLIQLVFATEFGQFKLSLNQDYYIISLIPTSDNITEIDSKHKSLIKEIFDYFDGSVLHNFALSKMMLEGTDFQKAVWRELYNIPHGKTISYGEIANKIGHPKAVRAVGTAVSSNPIPVLLPCHRVLPASGKLGNYAYGWEMKKSLLEREGAKFL